MNRKAVDRFLVFVTASAGLWLTVGCLRHKPKSAPGVYRLQHFSEVIVLAPPGGTQVTGDARTTLVSIGKKQGLQRHGDDDLCSINGPLFSLQPGTDGVHWRVTSPTAEAWNKASVLSSGESEWLIFTDHIATIASHDCFPSGVDSNFVQRRIAEAIPIPADQGLRFYYSLNSASFVDLRPGMQVRIETIGLGTQDEQRPRSQILQLSVVSQVPSGVRFEAGGRGEATKARGESQYRRLTQEFRKYPYLRLFLEQAETATEPARKAVLLGALTSESLEHQTQVIQQNPTNPCSTAQLTGGCVFFSDSGVSLLTSMSLNGHPAFYPPGTTLSQLIGALPEAHRARALATLRLYREYEGGEAPVSLPRNEEDLFNVVLINGDRMRWRE